MYWYRICDLLCVASKWCDEKWESASAKRAEDEKCAGEGCAKSSTYGVLLEQVILNCSKLGYYQRSICFSMSQKLRFLVRCSLRCMSRACTSQYMCLWSVKVRCSLSEHRRCFLRSSFVQRRQLTLSRLFSNAFVSSICYAAEMPVVFEEAFFAGSVRTALTQQVDSSIRFLPQSV